MQLSGFRSYKTSNGRVGAACRVQCDRAAPGVDELYIEVPAEYAGCFALSVDGFALAALVAARELGERRLLIDGELCVELAENLEKFLLLQDRWRGHPGDAPELLASAGRVARPRNPVAAAGGFMSGGIDSLAMALWNRQTFPPGHPLRIGHYLFVHGLDVGDPNKPDRPEVFRQTLGDMQQLLGPAGDKIIPVYTNFRQLCPDWRVYAYAQFGSLLAAIAHFFQPAFSTVVCASDNAIRYVYEPYGCHPWANQYLGSSGMQFRTALEHLQRLPRARLLADWPEALSVLRVCYMMDDIPGGQRNCGRCAKCLRTKMDLLAAGCLDRADTFPDKTIPADRVAAMVIRDYGLLEYVEELIEPMRACGREDLAQGLAQVVDRYRRYRAPTFFERARGHLRHLARRYLSGRRARGS